EAPGNLTTGFAPATGGFTNLHGIRNIVGAVSDAENLQSPQLNPKSEAVCEGDSVRFQITEEDVHLAQPHSSLSSPQLYPSSQDVIDEDAQDPCSVERCSPVHQRVVLQEGVFAADATGGGLSFTPASDFKDGEVVVYYTVTDNYGKTSAPEKL